MRLTVDFLVPVTVKIDTAIGEVGEVWLHGDSFQHHDGIQVFAGSDPEWDGDEYLDLDHPEAKRALELADGIRLDPPEFKLNWTKIQ